MNSYTVRIDSLERRVRRLEEKNYKEEDLPKTEIADYEVTRYNIDRTLKEMGFWSTRAKKSIEYSHSAIGLELPCKKSELVKALNESLKNGLVHELRNVGALTIDEISIVMETFNKKYVFESDKDTFDGYCRSNAKDLKKLLTYILEHTDMRYGTYTQIEATLDNEKESCKELTEIMKQVKEAISK